MSTLNGTVFNDTNFNGIFDAGDFTQPNVVVFLDTNSNSIQDVSEVVELTDVNGFYSFDNLSAGSFTVAQIVPPGFVRSTPVSPVTLTGATTEVLTFNLANTTPAAPVVPFLTGNITGAVFVDNTLRGELNPIFDADGNLVYDEAGNLIQDTILYDPFEDATVPGVPVYIDLNNDGFYNANEPLSVSNEAGFYSFELLPPGSYLLRVAQPFEVSGESPLLDDLAVTSANPEIVDVLSGVTTRNDVGVVVPNSVYGAVINDLNGNGFIDANEPGIAGVTVYIDENENGVYDLGENADVSGANGSYLIDGLDTEIEGVETAEGLAQNPYEAYQVIFDPESIANGFAVRAAAPSDVYVRTSPLPGQEVDPAVVPGGSAQVNFLYGVTSIASPLLRDSITGFVFNDFNGNGAVEAGEPGIPGVEVYADLDNDAILDAGEPVSATDSLGKFGFLNLATPGDYVIRADQEFLTTAVPNVILGAGQAAQLAIGIANFEPVPAIDETAIIPVPGFNVV